MRTHSYPCLRPAPRTGVHPTPLPAHPRANDRRTPALSAVLAAALLCCAAPVQAQTLHLAAGYNGTNVPEHGTERWSGRSGYQLGADLFVGNRLFVKPGVHYLVRNLRYTLVEGAATRPPEYRYTERSLSVPLMLGANMFEPNDAFSAYVMVGPTALLGLSADLQSDAMQADTKALQWQLGFGAGVGYGPVFVEGGYNAGVSTVFEGATFSTNPRVNYGYCLLGLRFRLKP